MYIVPEKQPIAVYAQVIRTHRANGLNALANATRALAMNYYDLKAVDAEVERQDKAARNG